MEKKEYYTPHEPTPHPTEEMEEVKEEVPRRIVVTYEFTTKIKGDGKKES